MPWKAPTCGRKDSTGKPSSCYWDKMKFAKWINEYPGWAKDEFHRGQYWEAEYVCGVCGNTRIDVKMRTTRQLRNAGIIL